MQLSIYTVFIFCSLLVLSRGQEKGIYDKSFYDACAQGNIERVKELIESNPNLPKEASPDGESCLHLTAISNNLEISKLMIELGADVNKRVTHDLGLRMMPLHWHVYGGNYDIIKLLLDNGADVNADVDHNVNEKATPVDLSALHVKSKDPNAEPDNYVRSHELLISKGGKKYSELS